MFSADAQFLRRKNFELFPRSTHVKFALNESALIEALTKLEIPVFKLLFKRINTNSKVIFIRPYPYSTISVA